MSPKLFTDKKDCLEKKELTDDKTIVFEDFEKLDEKLQSAYRIISRKGKNILEYNGYSYRRLYKTKRGHRWACSRNKYCHAYIYTNDDNEILESHEVHLHELAAKHQDVNADESETAIVINSRKGKTMLLLRKYTYRKQYAGRNRIRWVCSTNKNCRACVFTNTKNILVSAFDKHYHDPPKYYLKPENFLEALREPLIFDAD